MSTRHQSPGAGSTVQADELIFLAGRPPMSEFLGFVEFRAFGGDMTHRAQLADQWRAANDRVHQLEQLEAGVADAASTAPLPSSLRSRQEKFLSDSTITANYSIVPVELAMVDLDCVVVYQKFIDLGYAARLADLLPDQPAPRDLFDFALPLDGRYDVPTTSGQIGQNNAWAFTSPSTDFRVLSQQLIDPRSVAGLQVAGRPTAIVAVAVGYGSNVLNTVSVNGRLLLLNGSHRAYALRAAGHQHVPCLIQSVSRPEELEALLDAQVLQQLDLYIGSPRPPMLRDYFDEELHVKIRAPRIGRQIQVVVQAQPTDLLMA